MDQLRERLQEKHARLMHKWEGLRLQTTELECELEKVERSLRTLATLAKIDHN
jgi:prefoldin subunit 5